MTRCQCTANDISLLLFQSLEKIKLSKSQFPLEVLHSCYKAAIKFPEYAFCLYLQMVSHAIKIFCVSKKPDGKVVNTRIFYARSQATSIPCAFHLCQYIKGEVFFWSNKEMIFFPLLLLCCSTLSLSLFLLYYHMSKGKIVGFMPEALKASSVEQICWGQWGRWVGR